MVASKLCLARLDDALDNTDMFCHIITITITFDILILTFLVLSYLTT